ncbi:c-type cytochrome domain-containing protein [Maribacter antarcticus]|uniref:c-type cytochrome domain-containing protein n=1 Tax=Maribacter antarcticus TaxID=505250 RepID=UPI00047CDF60|nr:c-type cytochrome domain-containing protein [Maribacter antarcticus]
MTKPSQNRWVDYAVFGLSLFLLFCLLFDTYIKLPRLIAWVGRWHPLVLHFPIVLLLLCAFLGLTGRKVPKQLLTIAVLLSLLTAISGFFLGKEMAPKGDLLFWHQWMGGGLALLAAVWYGLVESNFNKPIFYKILQVTLIGLIFATGHYGGMVTHGENFLALPSEKRANKIPENPLLYKDVVGRILENKCVSCHNPNKTKGGLLMTSLDALLAGGEVGNTIQPGNPEESEMIRRVHLPIEDEEHMPPEDKQALNEQEIEILERWIALGASDTLRLVHLQSSEQLKGLVEGLMQPDTREKWAKLPEVADSTLQRLNTDYVTIKRIAGDANALSVNVYKSPRYVAKQVTGLNFVSQNIVQLDISGLPIGQDEMNFIGSCANLEWLELDKTPITDTEIEALNLLSKLKTLKIYSTAISDGSIAVFNKMDGLREIYLWNTKITATGIKDLKSKNPMLRIEGGIAEELRNSFVISDSL